MKHRRIWCALGLGVLLLSGCAQQQQQSQVENIAPEQARQAVLSDLGLGADKVQISETKLESRDGLDYYAVSLTVDGQTLRYNVDALTGTIIDKGDLAAAQQGTGEPVVDAVSGASPKADTTATKPADSGASGAGTAKAGITAEQAKAKALEHAGLTAAQVSFVQAKLDYEAGRQIYDVEFFTKDKEYDYEIDAASGEIISFDYDADHYTASSGTGDTKQISVARAKEIALAQVAGAKSSDIYEFETDYDDGRLSYEGKIVYGDREYDFEIDGYSGAIRSWETEPLAS